MTPAGGEWMNAKRLRELLIYDPLTGSFTHRTTRGPCKEGSLAGCLNALGYIRICVDYVDYAAHRLVWLYQFGSFPSSQIDHINGNRADNRLCNLRLADNSQNNQNRPLQRNSTSGFKGVSLHKQSGRWFAYATKNGRRVSGGYHESAEQAFAAATALRTQLHGEYAKHDYRKVTP